MSSAPRTSRQAASPAPRSWSVIAVFAGAWLVLLSAGRAKLLRDPGTFWHILAGDRLLSTGFPSSDWLSFSFMGKPWIAHQWLGECAMSLLHRLGGLDALVVATSAGLALLLAWLFHRLVEGGLERRYALLATAVCFLASSLHFHVRPHLFSIIAFAWLYQTLVDFEAGRVGLVRLVWLWPLFLVWVNVHGAVVGGLATVALAAAAWLAAWMAGWSSPVRSTRDAAALTALLVAFAASVLLNPYGLELPRTWSAILRSPGLAQTFVEHGSIVRTGSWQVLLLAALYGSALIGTGRLTVTALLPTVWLVLAFGRIRHAPFFAVAATLALPGLLPRSRAISWLAGRGVQVLSPTVPQPRRFPRACVMAAAVGLAITGAVHHGAGRHEPFIAQLQPRFWPMELVPALRSAAADLPVGAPILNDIPFGGFIAYHAPTLRVFVDDRWELYGDHFMLAQVRADPAWLDAWARRSGAELAMAAHGTGLERYLDSAPRWSRIATASAGALYRRSRSEPGLTDQTTRLGRSSE